MATIDQSQLLPKQLASMDTDRLSAYKTHLGFYKGDQWDRPQRRNRPRSYKQLTFNYARALVDKVASYTLAGLTVGVEPLSESQQHLNAAAEAEAVLTQISDDNNLPRLDFDAEIDTSVLGDGAFKVLWDSEERRVAITAPDVQGIFVWPYATRFDRARRICQRYELAAADILATWNYNPKKDPATVLEEWTAEALTVWVDEQVIYSEANPYHEIPLIVYPNLSVPKQWYGASDILPAVDTAKEINRELSNLAAIMELSGNPISVLENVDESANIEASPGAVWQLPEDAKAYLLDLLSGGGVRLHVDYLGELMRTLHDITETPRTAFGSTNRDISGIALQVELQPLLQKVDRKRLIRTDALKRRALLALKVYDHHNATNHAAAGRITVSWSAPTLYDRSQEISNERDQVSAGLTTRKASMARLGEHDPEARYAQALAEAKEWGAIAPAPPADKLTTNAPLV